MTAESQKRSSAEWARFCQQLQQAGDDVLNQSASERELAEGLRYLSRLTRVGLKMHLEHADPLFPRFYQASDSTTKIGADNPDNFYQNATISGEYRYRISGTRGNVPILSFGTKANRYAIDGTMASTGELDSLDMELDDQGRFEIIVSREKSDGNWLPLDADSSMLIVRQTFFQRDEELPATVEIECLDAPDSPAPASLPGMTQALDNSAAFVGGTARLFVNWAQQFKRENLNRLNTTDQSMFSRAGGDPTIYYLHGYWALEPDQALFIHTRIPECTGWNFQLNNYWMESLDYRYHPIHVNNGTAEYNDDGSVTVVVAAENKGYKNWINTTGLSRGTMLWRWTNAKQHPLPITEVKRV